MFPAPSRESQKEECSSVIEYFRKDNEEEEDNIDYSELTIAQLPNTPSTDNRYHYEMQIIGAICQKGT
jgi:hypothetical protein